MGGVAYLDDGPRVLSVYEGFFSGGARVQHTSLVRSLQATTGQRHVVLGLADRAVREATVQRASRDLGYRRLVAAGVPVETLRRSTTAPVRGHHLAALERAAGGADVVLSLKEQPLAALSRVDLGGRPVLVGLHRSDPERQGGLDDLVAMVGDGRVASAVCCAASTQRAYHAATGIALDRLPVVPNGVDLHRFRPDAEARAAVRAELGVRGDEPVVLLSARFDPMKDVGLFLAAAGRFARHYPGAHLVLCGAGMDAGNAALTDLVPTGLARERVHLLGIRADMPRLYNGADVVALTSAYGEAAPLSLLEGMACGAVPVTTDVGDAALLVRDARLVTERDDDVVALAWEAAFEQREEHAERILRHRQRLSDQRGFDAWARLVDEVAAARSLPLAG